MTPTKTSTMPPDDEVRVQTRLDADRKAAAQEERDAARRKLAAEDEAARIAARKADPAWWAPRLQGATPVTLVWPACPVPTVAYAGGVQHGRPVAVNANYRIDTEGIWAKRDGLFLGTPVFPVARTWGGDIRFAVADKGRWTFVDVKAGHGRGERIAALRKAGMVLGTVGRTLTPAGDLLGPFELGLWNDSDALRQETPADLLDRFLTAHLVEIAPKDTMPPRPKDQGATR